MATYRICANYRREQKCKRRHTGPQKDAKRRTKDGKREDKRHATADAEACLLCIYKGETAHKKSTDGP